MRQCWREDGVLLLLLLGLVVVLGGVLWLGMGGLPVTEAQAPTPACHDIRINAKGTNGAAITVSTAVVPVVDANTSRCRLTITNATANPVNCAETTGKYQLTPSTTVGLTIPGNTILTIPTQAGQQAWSCIRQGGTDSSVTVAEDLP